MQYMSVRSKTISSMVTFLYGKEEKNFYHAVLNIPLTVGCGKYLMVAVHELVVEYGK